MKNTIIITTPEELEGLITTTVRNAISEHKFNLENNKQDYLTLKQACEFLNLAPQTIYGLTSKNLIPHIKGAKKLSFLKSSLEQWLLEGGNSSIAKIKPIQPQ